MRAEQLGSLLGPWTEREGTLPARLSRAIVSAIEVGALAAADRLPAERELAEALAVSRTTVAAAYHQLRQDGWVRSRRGSGSVIEPRATVAIHNKHAEAAAGVILPRVINPSVPNGLPESIDLAAGTPDSLPQLPLLLADAEPHLRAVLREHRYLTGGLPELCEQVAEMFAARKTPTRASQILLTNGGQQAIALIAAWRLQRGDAVIVESPTYFGALDVFRLAGARLRPVLVGPEGVDPQAVMAAARASAPQLIYLQPSFQNPTGAVMPKSCRKEMARFCSDSGVALVEDETLAPLHHLTPAPLPIARYAPDAPVLTIGSLNKSIWTGLRVGWIRGPEPIIRQLSQIKSTLDLGGPLLGQAMALSLLPRFDSLVQTRRVLLDRQRDQLIHRLRDRLPRWKFTAPPGGIFLWVRLPDGNDAAQFAQIAQRQRVRVLAGSLLSVDGLLGDWLRLSFLRPVEETQTAVDRLAQAWSLHQRMQQGPSLVDRDL